MAASSSQATVTSVSSLIVQDGVVSAVRLPTQVVGIATPSLARQWELWSRSWEPFVIWDLRQRRLNFVIEATRFVTNLRRPWESRSWRHMTVVRRSEFLLFIIFWPNEQITRRLPSHWFRWRITQHLLRCGRRLFDDDTPPEAKMMRQWIWRFAAKKTRANLKF